MADTKWVIQVNEELSKMEDLTTEKEHWSKGSIYKLPVYITDINKKAYKPQVATFGPYHFDHLNTMEENKHRALLHFLKRCGKPLELFVNALTEVVQDLKESYNQLDPGWKDDTSRFLQLMILDGCFMLEVVRIASNILDDYALNDPVFSNHGKLHIIPYIKRDMLMIENQLPMLVLNKLVEVESKKDELSVTRLLLKFYSSGTSASNMGKCLHVLDVYRKSLLQSEPQCTTGPCPPEPVNRLDVIIWSATELNEAGIRFKKSKTGSLKDISFSRGILRLPVILVDDTTESMFLNLIAFERFHVGAGNEVTSYTFFMDNIIDNARDVALLHSKGIVQNALGSDKAVANLFNSLSKDITLDPESSLDAVHKKVYHYCRKPWNEWRANLIHTYFRNPWAVISLVAGVFLFVLTIAQTGYSIIPYYYPNDSPPTCTCVPVAPPHVASSNHAYSTSPSKFILPILISVGWMLTK
ncbi:UPF0481 protein At3g47200-like [Prunus avium]|uniref:UPF0481 protein At3g47200-like n=1 Tax=Prunus avium TaxID=42229 RepID=A0A6P5TJW9_PRUAV|nr:UPF0481 protein At3g47200-like [Prunus avium]